jgi:hypothetical protein
VMMLVTMKMMKMMMRWAIRVVDTACERLCGTTSRIGSGSNDCIAVKQQEE